MIDVNILLCVFVISFDLFHLSYQVRKVGGGGPTFPKPQTYIRVYACIIHGYTRTYVKHSTKVPHHPHL
jgi:hypothetical protein